MIVVVACADIGVVIVVVVIVVVVIAPLAQSTGTAPVTVGTVATTTPTRICDRM